MTLQEFRLHRPRLSARLEEFVESVGTVVGVLPEYDHGLRFSAMVEWDDGESRCVVLCVAPSHPMFMETDGGPGCTGTWWWEEDVVRNGYDVP